MKVLMNYVDFLKLQKMCARLHNPWTKLVILNYDIVEACENLSKGNDYNFAKFQKVFKAVVKDQKIINGFVLVETCCSTLTGIWSSRSIAKCKIKF